MTAGTTCKAQLSSLKRGLSALGLLNPCGTLTASRLGIDLQLPRTTARRILDTLAAEGYVRAALASSALLQGQIAYAGLGMRYVATAIESWRLRSTVAPRLRALAATIDEALRAFPSGDPDDPLSHSGVSDP